MNNDIITNIEESLSTLSDEQLRYLYFTVSDIYERRFTGRQLLFELSNEELDFILNSHT